MQVTLHGVRSKTKRSIDVNNPHSKTKLKIIIIYQDQLLQCQHKQCFIKSKGKCYTYQFGTNILVGNKVPKYVGGKKYKEEHPWMDICTLRRNLHQQLGMGGEGGS